MGLLGLFTLSRGLRFEDEDEKEDSIANYIFGIEEKEFPYGNPPISDFPSRYLPSSSSTGFSSVSSLD